MSSRPVGTAHIRIADTPEDQQFMRMAIDPPGSWPLLEMSRDDLVRLLVMVHSAGLAALKTVAAEAGVSVDFEACMKVPIGDFAQEILDEMRLRRTAEDH